LMDATLRAADVALGFDFRAYVDFVNDRPGLIYLLAAGYRSILWQICVIVVALPLLGHHRRAAEFNCAFMLALIATTCISALVPAIGAYNELRLFASDFPNFVPQGYYDTLRDAPRLRVGSLRALDLFQLVGVLTFPSFHAVSAVLYAWAFWPIRWLRPLALLCNGAMMAATPVGGGHYLVDLLAGIVVAAAAIYAARLVVRRFADAKISREAPIPYREDSRDAPGRAIEPVGCGSALAGAAAGAGRASAGGFGGSGSTPCISG